jgi:uncharacterized protein (DUF488 family)
MPAFDLFTIGHSNIPAERFIALLRGAGVDAIADVRSIPASRFCPWFSAKNLAPLLAGANVVYVFFGEELGGRPRNPSAMAQRAGFRADIDRLLAMARERCLCLMCSERDPLDCHRCLLVARALAARGVSIGHILHNGEIESHTATERRLLKAAGEDGDLFVTGQDERLAAAYRHRARAVAYRLKGVNKTPEKMTNKRATTINKKIRAKKKSR